MGVKITKGKVGSSSTDRSLSTDLFCCHCILEDTRKIKIDLFLVTHQVGVN